MEQDNYNNVYMLVGEVIRQAIIDYMREIPPITKGMTESQIQKIRHWSHDKATATAFFKNSRLFKLSQINFEWLVEQYNAGAFGNVNDEEDYAYAE